MQLRSATFIQVAITRAICFAACAWLLAGTHRLESAEPVSSPATTQVRTDDAEPRNPFGTCVHFGFRKRADFAGWDRVEPICELIAAAGLGWIRDEVAWKEIETTPGQYQLPEDAREWIDIARAHGLDIILILNGDNPIYPDPLDPQAYGRAAAWLAEQLSGQVHVFELLNEPNNFTVRPRMGGPWNGFETDGSVSPWIRRTVEMTNAAAEAIKRVRPDATVVGLGMVTPANYRALDLGVTRALDGVVEHPYSFALPPELLPYGGPIVLKRDGLATADEDHSYASLMRRYREKFASTGGVREIWVTENGYTTFRINEKNRESLYAGYSERAQAKYLVRRFVLGLACGVKVQIQYDSMDDYGADPYEPEANFGLVRPDLSPKPSYEAVRRLCGFFQSPVALAEDVSIEIVSAPVHQHRRFGLITEWDGDPVMDSDAVEAHAFRNDHEVLVAFWSAERASEEYTPRQITLRLTGLEGFGDPVATDIMSGLTRTLTPRREAEDLIFERVDAPDYPTMLTFRKKP